MKSEMDKNYSQGPCGFGNNFPSTPNSNVKETGNTFGSKAAVKGTKNIPSGKPPKTKARGFSARGK